MNKIFVNQLICSVLFVVTTSFDNEQVAVARRSFFGGGNGGASSSSSQTKNSSSSSETDAFVDPMLRLQNKHRENAGLKQLKWNSTLASEAKDSAADFFCKTKLLSQMVTKESFVLTMPYSRTSPKVTNEKGEKGTAESMFNSYYDNATATFKFSGENSAGFGSCFSDQERAEDLLNDTLAFVSLLFKESKEEVGCFLQDCSDITIKDGKSLLPKTKPGPDEYVLSCKYSTDSTSSEKKNSILKNKNFLNLCNTEPGKWRSCDKALEEQCKKAALPETKPTTPKVVPKQTEPVLNAQPPANQNDPNTGNELKAYEKLNQLLSNVDKNPPAASSETKPGGSKKPGDNYSINTKINIQLISSTVLTLSYFQF